MLLDTDVSPIIKKVVIEKSTELDNWNESLRLSQEMFSEAGVELIIKGEDYPMSEITHWMPLPEPPTNTGVSADEL